MTTTNEFIEFMIDAGVLRFGEFKTKSGRLSPYFVNTGNYCMGSQLHTLGQAHSKMINVKCGTDYTALYGTAYNGFPLSSTVASALYSGHSIYKP